MSSLTCPFCWPAPGEVVLENDLCYTRYGNPRATSSSPPGTP